MTNKQNQKINKAKKFFFASIGLEGQETECFFVTTETGESFVFELPHLWMKSLLESCGKNVNDVCLTAQNNNLPEEINGQDVTSFAYLGKK
jgi:hypothetical protein